jgi:hypothetical protein
VVFNFVNAISSEPVLRLPLNHLHIIRRKYKNTYLVDEVRSCCRPTIRNVSFLNLDLLLKNVIPNVLSCFSDIRSLNKLKNNFKLPTTYFSEHAFEGHDTYSKVVNAHCMVQPAHDLRSHITWCTRSVLRVIFSPLSGNAEVSNSEIA